MVKKVNLVWSEQLLQRRDQGRLREEIEEFRSVMELFGIGIRTRKLQEMESMPVADGEMGGDGVSDGDGGPETEGTIWITDRVSYAKCLKAAGACVLMYLTDENRKEEITGIGYAVESLEGVDADYLEKVCRRHLGLPWEILRTGRLLVREMTIDDLDALYHIYEHPEVTRYMEGLNRDREKERDYTAGYIKTVYPFYGFGVWLLEEKETGRIVGRAGFSMQDASDCPELGFVIAYEFQGLGYAFEACSALLDYGFEELGFERIQALVREGNTASEGLCRKLGFMLQDKKETGGKRYSRYVMEPGG